MPMLCHRRRHCEAGAEADRLAGPSYTRGGGEGACDAGQHAELLLESRYVVYICKGIEAFWKCRNVVKLGSDAKAKAASRRSPNVALHLVGAVG